MNVSESCYDMSAGAGEQAGGQGNRRATGAGEQAGKRTMTPFQRWHPGAHASFSSWRH